jgi:hypothetical protein
LVEKKAAPQPKTKKPARKTKVLNAAAAPDSVPTDGSSSRLPKLTRSNRLTQQPLLREQTFGFVNLPTDEGEWQTVGRKSAPPLPRKPEVAGKTAQAPASKNGSSKKQSVPALKEEAAPVSKGEAKRGANTGRSRHKSKENGSTPILRRSSRRSPKVQEEEDSQRIHLRRMGVEWWNT